jgi:HEAT repeat protein
LNLQRVVILVLLSCASGSAAAQTSPRSQVGAAIDSWSDHAGKREEITKITRDPVTLLAAIAKSSRQPDVRRSHAIALLATFKEPSSEHVLNQLVDDRNPKYRCLALQSLTELEARGAVPALVRKLNDQAVCMKTVSTDPAQDHDVYVSDEAGRLLEQLSGQSFEQKSANGHRGTKPWKEWWAKQKASAKSRS